MKIYLKKLIYKSAIFFLVASFVFEQIPQAYALNQLNNWAFTGNSTGWTLQSDSGTEVCGTDTRATTDIAFETSAYSSNTYVMALSSNSTAVSERDYIYQTFTVPGTGSQLVRGGFSFTSSAGSYNATLNSSWARIDVYDSTNTTFVGTLGCRSFNSAQATSNIGFDRLLTLTGGTTYTIAITGRTINSDGNTDITFTFDNIVVTTAPVGVTAIPSGTSIQLDWTTSTGHATAPAIHATTPYKVYRGTSSGSETYLGDATTNSYTDTTTSASTKYYYWITNLDTSNYESASSTEVSVTSGSFNNSGRIIRLRNARLRSGIRLR